jgi:hypothetical protein
MPYNISLKLLDIAVIAVTLDDSFVQDVAIQPGTSVPYPYRGGRARYRPPSWRIRGEQYHLRKHGDWNFMNDVEYVL